MLTVLTHCHSVLGQCSCFVGTYDRSASQCLNSVELSYKTVFHLCLLSSERQADLHDTGTIMRVYISSYTRILPVYMGFLSLCTSVR